MSDSHQTGVEATLSKNRPIALVLPSLYSEIEGPALDKHRSSVPADLSGDLSAEALA